MKKEEKINEGIFGAAKKFSDAFFDGLKNNAADRVLQTAKKQGVPKEVTDLMDKIKKEKEELDAILQRISKY
jgi:cell division protein FtsL